MTTDIDKIDENKVTVVDDDCVRKNNIDGGKSRDAKRKTEHAIQRCVDEPSRDIYM